VEIQDRQIKRVRHFIFIIFNIIGDTFVSRITETVINNLQVQIKDVHVRYEDYSDKERPIVFGVTMSSLEAESTDENWNSTFIKVVQGLLYKIVKLKEVCDMNFCINIT
jgi:hypothetical protein